MHEVLVVGVVLDARGCVLTLRTADGSIGLPATLLDGNAEDLVVAMLERLTGFTVRFLEPLGARQVGDTGVVALLLSCTVEGAVNGDRFGWVEREAVDLRTSIVQVEMHGHHDEAGRVAFPAVVSRIFSPL